MNKLTIKKEHLRIIDYIFITIFFVYATLGSNNITYGDPIISWFMWPSFGLAFLICIYRLIHYKDYIKMPAFFALVALLASLVVSTFVSFKSHFKDNLVFCIYWAIFFFILYTLDNEIDIASIKKRFHYIMIVYMCFMTVAVIVSLVQMYNGYSEKFLAEDTGYVYYGGFAIGRLWGIFINTNTGAISAGLAIAMLVYLFISTRKIILKVLYALDMILQLMFIALSDSRSGAVCLGVSLGFFVLAKILYKCKEKKTIWKIVAVFLAIATMVVGFFIPRKAKDIYNNIIIAIEENNGNEVDGNNVIDEEIAEENQNVNNDEINLTVIDRGYDTSGDISNRRFDAWKSAVEVFASSPKSIIIGVTFRGFTDYAKENLPETYIVNNDYADFSTLDNEFFNILVSQGILGIIPFILVVVILIKVLFVRFYKVAPENESLTAVSLAIVAGLAVSALFVSVMFYQSSHNAVLFWITLGSLIMLLTNSGTEVRQDEN